MKKYAIISLGCSKNLVDSEKFSAILDTADYQRTEELNEASVIIINTCAFILPAKEESIETILEMVDWKINGKCEKIIVTGCMIKRYKDVLAQTIPEIDEIIELKDFENFAQIFHSKSSNKRNLLTPPHYAYLRISDGCNNNCSYCIIPQIRGNLKSVPISELIKEAKKLTERGVKELIITAQDSAAYGIDIYREFKLVDLLQALEKISNLQWIRLLYLHPAHLSQQIIGHIAKSEKILPYFEIPIQHINDRILKRMNRKVDRKKIENIIFEIRKKIPRAIIRTSLISGFPGENEADFEELKNFIKKTKFERLGVFSYSREENTKAAEMPDQVPEKIAEKRKQELMEIQADISENFLASLIGKKIDVIIDEIAEEKEFAYIGRSYFDAPEIDGVVYIESGNAEIGKIVTVQIIDSWEYDLVGRII